MPVALNITRDNSNNTIPNIDEKNYLRLSLPAAACSRKELFNFALALGCRGGFPKTLPSKVSLFRTETLDNDPYLYQAVFFHERIKNPSGSSAPDLLIQEAEVFAVVEAYANTGFQILADKMKTSSEEIFMNELLAEIDEAYSTFCQDFPE